MASVLSYLRELNIVTMMLRILLAVLCGGLIGLERERKNRPAGFRTYMLTALGATLTVLLSLQLDQMLHGPWREVAESIGATQDVSRFGAEAAKGIGFLGAGTIIITARQQVKGLTTAAGLWASACLGLTIGAGFYSCAFICIAYMAACMYLLPPLEQRLTRRAHQHHRQLLLKDAHWKWLGHIVLCTQFISFEHIALHIICGQEDHRCIRPALLYLTAEIKAIPIWQVYIQHDQVIVLLS